MVQRTRFFHAPRNGLLLLPLLAIPAVCDLEWPYNLPRHVKYYPEDEIHIKRDISVMDRMAWQKPNGVRKMSSDEGEMFFLDYWQFGEDGHSSAETHTATPSPNRRSQDNLPPYTNASIDVHPEPPFRPLSKYEKSQEFFMRFAARDILGKRQYQCPGGTRSCQSIDRPNSCCGSNDVCILIEDTGLGDVGCCASGASCAGTISECDTGSGYTSCPDSPNGGCCIPGYSCQDVGCVAINTAIVTQTIRPPPPSTTSQPPPPPPSTTSLTCSSGFQSCPASLGGGCCATDRACGPRTCPPLSTEAPTSGTAQPPVRPTSDSSIITAGPDSSAPPEACPTGFYMCSAFYRSACCRVGRDCQSTSCPAVNSEILNTNGITIGAPPGATVAPIPTGSCANGWYGCAAEQGGGCCPSGYGCGEVCTASASGASNLPKDPPSAASNLNHVCWLMVTAGWLTGVAMIML